MGSPAQSGSARIAITRSIADSRFATVNLNHFRLLRVVGKGAFGKVRIVERKDTAMTFALKYIRKDEGETRAMQPDAPADTRSGPIGECSQYYKGTPNARTSQPPIPLQSAIQLPRHRILVRGPIADGETG